MKNNISDISKDSLILTVVRVVTLIASIIQTMILSRIMSLSEYGGFSSIVTVINITTTISGLGLSQAISFFYNHEDNEQKRNTYIILIFLLTLLLGIISGIVLYFLRDSIALYYKNDLLRPLIIYIVLRPLFSNIIFLYPPLYISKGRAKTIAFRNLLVAIIQTIFVPLSFVFTHSLSAVLITQAILDIMQIFFFSLTIKTFNFNQDSINYLRNNFLLLIKNVLVYCIPMGISVTFGTLLKETDKLVIGRLMDSEHLALYTNMSRQLPFEFLVLSFTAVIVPVITKCWKKNDIESINKIWSNYVMFGIMTTWILCFGAILVAPELLVFLYSSKYLPGLMVFIIYLLTDMSRFCSFTLVLSATGKTKLIMWSSIISLVCNIILNIMLYKVFGFIGPAVASLITVILVNILQTIFSCHTVGLKFRNIFSLKLITKTAICLLLAGSITYGIRYMLNTFVGNYLVTLFSGYVIFIIINYLLLKKDIFDTLKEMKEI